MSDMSGLFAGTSLERPVTCEVCEKPLDECACPRDAAGKVVLRRHQTARISREKRAKGKIVTIVAGLDSVASDLADVLKELRKQCGTGGSVQDDELLLQGDHRERVAQTLREMGYQVKVS